MKKLVISILFVMNVVFVFAQTGTGFTGKVVDSKTQKPLQNVITSIQNTNQTQITDALGAFTFKDVSIFLSLAFSESISISVFHSCLASSFCLFSICSSSSRSILFFSSMERSV